MPLNITAMADVFTVLLVFLLKSFSTGAVNLTPSAGLKLPEAQAAEAKYEALKVEVTKDAILVEESPVVQLKDFRFRSGDIRGNLTSKSLSNALKKERKRQLVIAKHNKDVKVDAKVMIVADQRAPYQTIKSVLASAAVNGYTDFKMAVVRPE